MLIKHLLPKRSGFLAYQNKNSSTLWRFLLKRNEGQATGTPLKESFINWHPERHTCILDLESPINIFTECTTPKKIPPFKFSGYDKQMKLALAQNGHVVSLELPENLLMHSDGGLADTYIAHHAHFHFGLTSAYGSEHSLNNRRFPMELHIVNYNKKYGNIQAARSKELGLSVLAFFVKISMTANNHLKPIISGLKSISNPYSYVPIQLPSLIDILPAKRKNFYQYTEVTSGGVPSITWTVFKRKIPISEAQMAEFRKLLSVDVYKTSNKPVPIAACNRLPLGASNKVVYRSFDFKTDVKKTGSALEESMINWHPERHTCILDLESPINIFTERTTPKEIPPFKFSGYDKPMKLALAQNGHVVSLELPENLLMHSDGGLADTYIAHHAHFHFGLTSAYGSEHSLNNRRFPMELHIVSYNKKYGSIQAARSNELGLSVLAFFVKISMTANNHLKPIISGLKSISNPYSYVPIQLPSLSDILPSKRRDFYQYTEVTSDGVPSITWTVFKKRIHISEAQVAEFRKLLSVDVYKTSNKPVPIAACHRLPKGFSNKAVYRNFDIKSDVKRKK